MTLVGSFLLRGGRLLSCFGLFGIALMRFFKEGEVFCINQCYIIYIASDRYQSSDEVDHEFENRFSQNMQFYANDMK